MALGSTTTRDPDVSTPLKMPPGADHVHVPDRPPIALACARMTSQPQLLTMDGPNARTAGVMALAGADTGMESAGKKEWLGHAATAESASTRVSPGATPSRRATPVPTRIARNAGSWVPISRGASSSSAAHTMSASSSATITMDACRRREGPSLGSSVFWPKRRAMGTSGRRLSV